MTGHEDENPLKVLVNNITLVGNLGLPVNARCIVLFAHGSGSGRHSPRNRYVAQVLRENGLGTLLFDLLTAEEEASDMRTGHLRFDIEFLAARLIGITDWLKQNEDTKSLNIGYFGASTGAAAALVAAAERPAIIHAIVSRGGRPDLAGELLPQVKTPTLLIVGGHDFAVIDMNKEALAKLKSEKELIIIPGATHLFEEAGALEEVARLASHWFVHHLK